MMQACCSQAPCDTCAGIFYMAGMIVAMTVTPSLSVILPTVAIRKVLAQAAF